MPDFEVYYDDGDCCGTSKVYAIDTVRDRFLVVTHNDKFLWVDTRDCSLEDSNMRFNPSDPI